MVIAELTRSAAPAAGAPPNRAAAPASTPLVSSSRRIGPHCTPATSSAQAGSAGSAIAARAIRRSKAPDV